MSIRCGSLICKVNTQLNTEVFSDIVTYYVKYVGSIEILTSMKNIKRDKKEAIIQECIKRVCGSFNDSNYLISSEPDLNNSGTVVSVSISSCNISLVGATSGDVIAGFDMPRIAFSGHEDVEMSNYFVIAASNFNKKRICYVLEGIHDLAKDIVATIGYAFRTNLEPDRIYEELDETDPRYTEFPIRVAENFNIFDDVGCARKSFPDDKFIHKEVWYHGVLDREDAERFLRCNGDFLVRKSKARNGIHVLSGMTGGNKYHLVLTDPNGVIQSKDFIYESITHLINYHHSNLHSIFYDNFSLTLKTPVPHKNK